MPMPCAGCFEMPRLTMNFAASRPWLTPVRVLLALATLGCLHALLVRDDLLSQIDSHAEKIHKLERTLNHQELNRASVQRQNPQQLEETRHLVAELQRPWEGMLNALQRAASQDMQIVRLQPEADANRLVIAGQADSSDAFLSYVQRLRRDPSWKSVEPVSEERNVNVYAAGGKPVTFQLMAEWRPQ